MKIQKLKMILGFLIAATAGIAAGTETAQATTNIDGDPCELRLPYERAVFAAVQERFAAAELGRYDVLRAEMRLDEALLVCDSTSINSFIARGKQNLAEQVLLTRLGRAAGDVGQAELTAALVAEVDFRFRFDDIEAIEYCPVKSNYLNGQLAYATERFNAGEALRIAILEAELAVMRHRVACINEGIDLP